MYKIVYFSVVFISLAKPASAQNANAVMSATVAKPVAPEIPYIQSIWWDITKNPDLGELTAPKQESVDFAIWQAADGTWQLWGCMRNTAVKKNKRLLYGWEGKSLTDTNWRPTGIKLLPADENATVQAPFTFLDDRSYKMVFGNMFNETLYLKTSPKNDGKSFSESRRVLFSDTLEFHMRDPTILKIGSTYYAYYCAHPGATGAVYCRTSPDLIHWSNSTIVSHGGAGGSGPFDAESPFVISHKGWYYLFRTRDANDTAAWKTCVYASTDPLDFGIGNDDKLLTTLSCAAIEIIADKREEYIASFGAKNVPTGLPSWGGKSKTDESGEFSKVVTKI